MPWLRQNDGSWMVQGYHDVMASLRDARLVSGPHVEADRLHFPSLETAADLQHATLATWQAFAPGEVELVSTVGRSFGVAAAGTVLGITDEEVRSLMPAAEVVWRESATATSSAISFAAAAATGALAAAFGERASTHVQAFVALTHSLPALLSNVMVHSLLTNPPWPAASEAASRPSSSRAAIDEWLRCCAPARYVYRQVAQRLVMNGDAIEPGTSVAVDLESANFDPSVFPEPALVRPGARRAAHVAFGVAPRSCRGATTVHTALAVFLEAWLALGQTYRLALLSTHAETDFVAMRAWKRAVMRVEVA